MSDPITLERHLAEHVADIEAGDLDVAPFASCACGWHMRLGYERDWAKHVADTWREVRTVTTVEQLDALPVGSVVQEESEQHTWIRHGWLWHCSCDGCDIEWSTTGLFDEQQREPLLILWTNQDGAA